jgi:hypothetical protein
MHFWFNYTGIDTLPIGHLLSYPPASPVFDTGRYRAALTAAKGATPCHVPRIRRQLSLLARQHHHGGRHRHPGGAGVVQVGRGWRCVGDDAGDDVAARAVVGWQGVVGSVAEAGGV